MGFHDIKAYLREGFGFGEESQLIISNYIEVLSILRPLDSDGNIFKAAKDIIDGYREIYYDRRQALEETKKFKSYFQERVFDFMNREFGVSFTSEKLVRHAINEIEILVVEDNGNPELIKVSPGFAFDGYLELTKELKEYLGLDDKWFAIAWEAQGSYWHSLPKQQEADRKKKLICKEKNIILLEIWENWKEDIYLQEIIKQLKDQTGIEFTENKIKFAFRKFLGTRQP